MTTAPPIDPNARQIRLWLLVCAGMVFLMVVLGGLTRLTESGLSMVEWQPLKLLPPLTDGDWQAEFESYQKFPEFQKLNSWMSVEDFKGIYWLEFLHRLWGRIIGVVFAVPFFWFLLSGRVNGRFALTLGGLLVLGGAQGVLGWFMVASGLVDRPDVSQYRLAAHLVLAFVVYGALIWVALGVKPLNTNDGLAQPSDPLTSRLSLLISLAVLLVVMSGAFVAGLNAGMIYNTFPLMDGQIVPEGMYEIAPWYLNWFENVMTVQFNHRVLGILLAFISGFVWWRVRREDYGDPVRTIANALVVMVLIQAGLGIVTLLFVVPLPLALAHQAGALVVFTLAILMARLMHPSVYQCRVNPYSPNLDPF